MNNIELNIGERIDDLQYKGLHIIQNENYFCFGLDAVLLARFAMPKDRDVIIDLGTGTGIIPIMTSGLCNSDKIFGIDIQDCMVEMASRSIMLNSLDSRIKIQKCDIKDISQNFEKGVFSLVISNPPYIRAGKGIVNEFSQRAISRHEILCNIRDVVSAANYLLKDRGRLVLVYKPERMIECFDVMREYSIEPKKAQFIFPKADKSPGAVLIEGVKGANEGFRVMRPIIVMNDNGRYTCQIDDIYSDNGGDIFK